MIDLSRLHDLIFSLEQQAIKLDEQRGEQHNPLFDPQLFRCKSLLLVPCITELKNTYHEIVQSQEHQRLTTTQATYLTERLLNQLNAIQRELATAELRKKESHGLPRQTSISSLYQELAQHQDWERRLQEMIFEEEQRLETKSMGLTEKTSCQQAILTLEQRLIRCQQSRQRIENKITARERKGFK
ncbi:primosomal replication protein PriC [Vibrio gazogenes]|jgi:primosomal replication protein N''|uniref:Restart primosome assembly protein PriC n=1 Tax=Vibrio gazogenes DSM 21264 = NBRC 103151 TaxID=1123492 RepID=A0A1M5DWL6_VIBGA|nr:primosomal replication protein [Vibrio gazogenes]USP14898.1 primosomal replication protein [Vibrio gazogenes]SHF71387.1 restart primosome assembly protein PriC [Vibrio gazogenes DSM 21264] [Vibrio gazogenes DSM 21264 = NBRC 103151]